jgi:hypothetical protein
MSVGHLTVVLNKQRNKETNKERKKQTNKQTNNGMSQQAANKGEISWVHQQ